MNLALWVGALCLAAAPAEAPNDILKSYESAKVVAGRDPEAQIKLALWCEAHGLKAERVKHLALAVLADPANATARGLLGLVAYKGRWQRPEAVRKAVESDSALSERLGEYNRRREKVGKSAEDHWRLGLWCEENGLKPESIAHFSTVVRLNPGHDAAWKRLGCKKVGGRWMTEEQIQEEKAEAEAQREADRKWGPALLKLKADLSKPSRRADAEVALAEINDPRAVPAVWAVLGQAEEPYQKLAIQVFGQLDSPAGSRYLMLLSVLAESPEVRRLATETLKPRDPREYVTLLIGMLRKPYKYEVRPVSGPGSQGVLYVEGEKFNIQRLYSPPPLPNIPLYAGEPVTYDAYGLPVISRFLGPRTRTVQDPSSYRFEKHVDPTIIVPRKGLERWAYRNVTTKRSVDLVTTPSEATLEIPIGQLMLQYQTAAAVAQQQLRQDIAMVEGYNAETKVSNGRVESVLGSVVGQDFKSDREAWSAWWTNEMGYAYATPPEAPRTTLTENVPLNYLPPGVPTRVAERDGPSNRQTVTTGGTSRELVFPFRHNCFRGGTLVRTLNGSRVIEELKVGDQVLTQDTGTGELTYQPILATFHNKPSQTLRVALGSSEVVYATPIHRFWKVGVGWTMARDLKLGDTIRTMDATLNVAAVEEDEITPVFNFEVAKGHSYFVGESACLVHDNSLVAPVARAFDSPAKIDLLAAKK